MKNYSPDSTETILADTSSAASQLQAEIDAMRRRLAALEARATRKRLALMIAGVMLAGATIVVGQSAVESLFVSKDGKVGIGTTTPVNKLSVNGDADISNSLGIGTNSLGTSRLKIANPSGDFAHFRFESAGARELEFVGWANGWNINSKTSGKNLYLNRDTSNSDVLIGPSTKEMIVKSTGNVGIGTTTPRAKLDVAGTIISLARHQKNDELEATYEISPRYHLTLSPPKYDGSTRQIPKDVINDLCGDPDGCQFRLGMTRWSSDAATETASITGLFYYSISDGHWRTSMLAQVGTDVKPKESVGVDGDKTTQHVADGWSVCFFTDSPYSNYQDKSDPDIGMYLLVWKNDTANWRNPGRTCSLTLID
ncbi:MAG TPA: hypothetical protein VJM50_14805 [Pyrinomonadaceae bacterium]|nr:hypothetical protein [Pyrinomonadaceae bacterium]